MAPRRLGAFSYSEFMLVKLLTVDEVAEFLSKPRSWVYENWRTEQIPFRRVGQSLRCRPSDLDRWLDAKWAE
ncbi:helix-turn-helix domain-containing protein [Streptomyces sp. NPDC001584]|uniref:helix-turn-helix domain-containing protein n=2 Tax=unclassified Streptomyces TaxID=2593676 RepID=UPI003327B164